MQGGRKSFEQSFGCELFKLRSRRGKTQIEIAALSQLNKGYYSQIENGRRPPPPQSTVQRIGAALDLDAAELGALCDVALQVRSKTRYGTAYSNGHGQLVLTQGNVELQVGPAKLRRIEEILKEK